MVNRLRLIIYGLSQPEFGSFRGLGREDNQSTSNVKPSLEILAVSCTGNTVNTLKMEHDTL